jgi:hypothetical protein
MSKRVYPESVKKWAIKVGLPGGTLIGLIFLYLISIGAITDYTYSGDSTCLGTLEDPCFAYINFTAKEDIFIYPTGYDPWGRNTSFDFSPAIKDWKLQRSWGKGWRNIPLDKSCTGTWCGLSNKDDTRKFSVAFREGRNYSMRIVVYKNKPTDTIKWSAFEVIDPYFYGFNKTKHVRLISNTDRCHPKCETKYQLCNGDYSINILPQDSFKFKFKTGTNQTLVDSITNLTTEISLSNFTTTNSSTCAILTINGTKNSRMNVDNILNISILGNWIDFPEYAWWNDTVMVNTNCTINEWEDNGSSTVGFDTNGSLRLGFLFESIMLNYWNMDTNGSVPDEKCGNSGLINVPIFTDLGVINGAYDYDGVDDYISIGAFNGIKTISVWFKSNKDITTSVFTSLWSDNIGKPDLFLGGNIDSGIANEMVSLRTGGGSPKFWWNSSVVSSPINQSWHHLVFYWNSSVSNYYLVLDNVNYGAATKTESPVEASNYTDFWLGKSTANPFNGTIDELIFYNETISNVSAIYNSGKGGVYNTSNFQFFSITNTTPTNISWIIPTINNTNDCAGDVSFRVSVDNASTWTNWLTDTNNSENISVTQGNNALFQINTTGNATCSEKVSNFGMLSGLSAVPSNVSDVNLFLAGFERNIFVELGSLVNASANTTNQTVCIDVDHPQGGINVSCGENETWYNINITYFRTTTFNDSTTAKNISLPQWNLQENYDSLYRNDISDNDRPNWTYGFDNNFSTYSQGNSTNVSIYLVNYTKPEMAISAQWEIKYSDTRVNKTVPDDCWDYSDTTINFRIRSCNVTGERHIVWQCQDEDTAPFNDNAIDCVTGGPANWSVGWKHVQLGGPRGELYEEQVYWNYGLVEIPAHQYDEVINLTINLTGIANASGSFPEDVEIYVNNTLSIVIGSLLNTTNVTLTSFNDTSTSKNKTFGQEETEIIDYFKIQKIANMTSASLNISGSAIDNVVFNTSWSTGTTPSVIRDITTDDNYVYVQGGGNIYNYSMNGTYQSSFVSATCDSSISGNVYGLSNNGTNFFVVYDDVAGSVDIACVLNFDGTQVSNFTLTPGNDNPRGIIFNGSLYWVNDADDVIRVYDSSGTFQAGVSASNGTNLMETDSFELSGDDLNIFGIGKIFFTTIVQICKYPLTTSGTMTATECWDFSDYLTSAGLGTNDTHIWYGNSTNTSYVATIDSYPTNAWMEVGSIDGTREWNFTGSFASEETTSDFNASIQSFLNSCTADSSKFCYVPVYLYSEKKGILNLENIIINYTYNPNPVVINTSLVSSYLSLSTNFTTIPLRIKSDGVGNITVDDIRYDYRGGNKTIEVKAHNPTYTANDTLNIIYYYSAWNGTFPNLVTFIEFIPDEFNSKNVTPYKQTSTTPILNITNWAYGGRNFNFSILINDSDDCINTTFSNSSNKSDGSLLINDTFIYIDDNSTYLDNFGLWGFADFNCNQSFWDLFDPWYYLRTCCVSCDVCDSSVGNVDVI